MNKREKEVLQSQLNSEKAVLKKLEANYQDALDEINSKIEILLARQDADMQHVIYQVEYQKALKTQVQGILDQLQANEFDTVSAYLASSYEEGFLGTMYDLHGQGIPLIMPINQEMVVAAIQHETKLSETLYSSLGKDVKDLNKKIAGEISRGIAGGHTYSEIARNVASWARIPKNNAMRIARTEAHRIQNKATADAQFKAKEKGADIVKVWSAALDSKTRKTHKELDGQIRELDEPFEVDGKKAMRPGAFNKPEEDINCRCRCNSKARWLVDQPYTKWDASAPVIIDDDGTTQFSIIESKNYEDFKKKYNKAVENVGKSSKMKLDLQFFARMPKEKFVDYALNPLKSPDKAKAFKEALGYDLDNYSELMKNIEEHIDESKFVEKGDNGHGMRYEYIMEITGVNGKKANVLTAWIQDGEEKRMTSVYVTKKKVTE